MYIIYYIFMYMNHLIGTTIILVLIQYYVIMQYILIHIIYIYIYTHVYFHIHIYIWKDIYSIYGRIYGYIYIYVIYVYVIYIYIHTCLLSTFGSGGNKRRKAVRREVYGRGINYRRFRVSLRNSPCYMRVDVTLAPCACAGKQTMNRKVRRRIIHPPPR